MFKHFCIGDVLQSTRRGVERTLGNISQSLIAVYQRRHGRRYLAATAASLILGAPAYADFSTAALNTHNAERTQYHDVHLRWSGGLAAFAQEWAQHLADNDRFEHRPADHRANGYPNRPGENLYYAQGSSGITGSNVEHAQDAVNAWIAEKQYYHYDRDTDGTGSWNLPPGCSAPSGKYCGHFTQVIWKNTTEVGCGIAKNAANTKVYVVCNYYSSGNVYGQRPYEPAAPGPQPIPGSGSVIALQADTGRWLGRCNGCQNAAPPDSLTAHVNDSTHSVAHFTVVDVGNGKVALKADTGMYLARCQGCVTGGYPDLMFIHAPNAEEGPAHFTLEPLNNGKFAIKADTGFYLARCHGCSPGAAYPDVVAIHADTPMPYAWAQWKIVRIQ
jgi:hypothetical protein